MEKSKVPAHGNTYTQHTANIQPVLILMIESLLNDLELQTYSSDLLSYFIPDVPSLGK